MLRCQALEPFARHFFTTADLRLVDDEQEWTGLAEFAGVGPDRLRLLHQVHGRTVVDAGPGDEAWGRPEADGITSRDPSVALVVRVADCAPVLLADPVTGAVAAVHAGWRSTMQRIVTAAVTSLENDYGSRPQDLVAAIGPSLGSCCGEMGDEVVGAFRHEGHSEASIAAWFDRSRGRPHFDLWRANQDQLVTAGVRPGAIHLSRLCTRSHPDAFHSYRARGRQAGRMAAVIRANP